MYRDCLILEDVGVPASDEELRAKASASHFCLYWSPSFFPANIINIHTHHLILDNITCHSCVYKKNVPWRMQLTLWQSFFESLSCLSGACVDQLCSVKAHPWTYLLAFLQRVLVSHLHNFFWSGVFPQPSYIGNVRSLLP